MNDLGFVLISLVVAMVFGFVLGISVTKESVETDCKNYGQYATAHWKLTCTKKIGE